MTASDPKQYNDTTSCYNAFLSFWAVEFQGYREGGKVSFSLFFFSFFSFQHLKSVGFLWSHCFVFATEVKGSTEDTGTFFLSSTLPEL